METSPLMLLVTGGRMLTMDAARRELVGWLAVDHDGRIAGLGEGDPPADLTADAVLDASGKLIGPGFVSAHSHLFTSGARGLAMDQSLYGWIEAMLGYASAGTADDVYWFTKHGAYDFLNNGITTAFDFTDSGLAFDRESDGVASYGDGNAVPDVAYQHAQLRAKLDAGLRTMHSVMLGQTTDRDAVFGHLDDVTSMSDELARHPAHLGLAISGTVQWAGAEEYAAVEVACMHRHGLLNQPHFLETPHEVELQRSKFAWYRDAGALGPDLVFGHFIQTTDEIIDEAAAAGCGMVWQPTSNGRLASGVANIPRCREVGMRVGVGLDDQSCTDISDPFQNLRFGIYLLRATYKDPAAMAVADMLELHTRGSAEVLGLGDRVGSLEVGKYADFCVVDPRDPDTGPVWDPYGTYVLACGLRNLVGVYVGGRLVSDRGRITGAAAADHAETVSQVHERMARIATSAT
ncbi:MAG: amidohydrolase family protein [Actinomycetota bacterium]|nr:amidohydrolase family protein [Actinomycetota bacterium]